MSYELPAVSAEELEAATDLQHRLLQFASLAHELASERLAALQAVNPNLYAGQRPLPASVWGDRYYEHVRFSYDGDCAPCVSFSGHWYVWADDGLSHQVAFAEVSVPLWVITDPVGADRFRAETASRVATATIEEAAGLVQLDALCEVVFAQDAIMAADGASREEIHNAGMRVMVAGILEMTETSAETKHRRRHDS